MNKDTLVGVSEDGLLFNTGVAFIGIRDTSRDPKATFELPEMEKEAPIDSSEASIGSSNKLISPDLSSIGTISQFLTLRNIGNNP